MCNKAYEHKNVLSVLHFALRIHYPLALPYAGKPDPSVLQETVRRLQAQVEKYQKQVHFVPHCSCGYGYQC